MTKNNLQAKCPQCGDVSTLSFAPIKGAYVQCPTCGASFVPTEGQSRHRILIVALVGALLTIGAIVGVSQLLLQEHVDDAGSSTAAKSDAKDSSEPLQEPFAPAQPDELDTLPYDDPLDNGVAEADTSTDPEIPANDEVTPNKPIALEFSPYFVGGPPKLSYPWKDESSYTCFFKVTMQSDEVRHEISGISTYDSLDPTKSKLESIGESGVGTGTAFVVCRQGYLVTCAHVVEGAKTIHVGINGKLVPARVVVYDPRNDLAVLKVDESDLTVLPLADTDELREGVALRAMGFPLASSLGTSLKVSRGKLVSTDESQPNGELQVDADLNPGNSGGPIINDYGRVVGVASSVMAFEEDSNVGHAVSAKTLRRLLSEQGVPFETNSNPHSLTGPQAIRHAGSAIALVLVETGADGVGVSRQSVRKFSCNYDLSIRRLGEPPYGPSPQFAWTTDGEMLVDTAGSMHEKSEDLFLPYLSVHCGMAGISSLPTANLDQWETRSEGVIAYLPRDIDPRKDARANTWIGYPYRYPAHLSAARKRSPSFGIMPGKVLPALEFAEFKVVASNDKAVTVRMHVDKLTPESEEVDAPAKLVAEAEIEYYKDSALISKMQWVGLLTLGIDSESVEMPIQASLRFGEGGYFKTDHSRDLVAEWKRVQEDLSSDQRTARLLGLAKLENDYDFERQSVLEITTSFLDGEDKVLRRAAMRAFVRRCGDAQIQTLVELMQDEDVCVASLAAERLCNFKSDEVIAIVADLFDQHSRKNIASAVAGLHSAGKDSERIFLALANHHNETVRKIAIMVLSEWGGRDTVSMAYRRMRAGIFVGNEKDSITKLFWKLAPPNHGSFRVRVVEAKPKPTETFAKLLLQLDSAETKEQQFVALKKLGLVKSASRLPDVYIANVINKYLKSEEHEVRILAYGLLRKLGSELNIPAMIEATNHENFLVRWAGIDGLRQFDNVQAAGAIAKRLSDPMDERAVRRALQQMLDRTLDPEVRDFINASMRATGG